METPSTPPIGDTQVSLRLSAADYGFFLLMAVVVMLVIWVGVMSFEEGMKTEDSKRNGETWVSWLTQASTKRFEAGYEIAECAAGLHAAEVSIAPAAASAVATPDGAREEGGGRGPKCRIPKTGSTHREFMGRLCGENHGTRRIQENGEPFYRRAPQPRREVRPCRSFATRLDSNRKKCCNPGWIRGSNHRLSPRPQ